MNVYTVRRGRIFAGLKGVSLRILGRVAENIRDNEKD